MGPSVGKKQQIGWDAHPHSSTEREKARTDSRRSRDDVDSFIAYLLYTTTAVAPHLPYSFFPLIISSLPPLFSRSDKEGVSKEGGKRRRRSVPQSTPRGSPVAP